MGSDVGYGELGFSSVVNLTLLLFHSISTTKDTNLSKVRFLGLESDNLAVFSIWYDNYVSSDYIELNEV